MEQRTTNSTGQGRLVPLLQLSAVVFGSISLLLSNVSPASAQAAEVEARDLRRGVQDCAAIAEPAARLGCFDQLATDVNAAPETFMVPIDRARVETLQRESFGFNLPDLSRLLPSLSARDDAQAPEVASVELQVERIVNRADGGSAFIMSNGQVWSQVVPQRVYNVRAGDTVTIRRASMGSFMLVAEHGPPHRVRREG